MRAGTSLVAALAVLCAVGARGGCVTDDTGTAVCLDRPPVRAVSLYGAFTETIAALGAGPALAARTKNDDTVPELAALPTVGTGLRPDVELLTAMKPDLVVCRGGEAGEETVALLRARGIKTAAFDPRSLAELYGTIERLGTLFGREAEAGKLVTRMKERIGAVEKRVAGAPPVKTAFEVRAEPLTLAGTDGLLAEMVTAAGGRLSVDTPKKLVRVDMEALLASDPDAYIVQEGPMNPSPSAPAARPHHAKLRAVRAGRVLVVDEKLLSRPGPRVPEAVEALSRFLHPSRWDAVPR
jgi:iron complex transport system substrate-binding protein